MADVLCVHLFVQCLYVCVCVCAVTVYIVHSGKSVCLCFTGSTVTLHEITLVNIAVILFPLCLRMRVF